MQLCWPLMLGAARIELCVLVKCSITDTCYWLPLLWLTEEKFRPSLLPRQQDKYVVLDSKSWTAVAFSQFELVPSREKGECLDSCAFQKTFFKYLSIYSLWPLYCLRPEDTWALDVVSRKHNRFPKPSQDRHSLICSFRMVAVHWSTTVSSWDRTAPIRKKDTC